MMWFVHPYTRQGHRQAVDITLCVCGMPILEGVHLENSSPSKTCARCIKGPDYSAYVQPVSKETDARDFERLKAANPLRPPSDPKDRAEWQRFMAKVEMLRKAFKAEVLV